MQVIFPAYGEGVEKYFRHFFLKNTLCYFTGKFIYSFL